MAKKCIICDNEARARGFCLNHYRQYRTPGSGKWKRKNKIERKICKVEGCERQVSLYGYCHMHSAQIVRTGHILQPKPTTKCMICGEPAKVKGFCRMHYNLYITPHPGYKKGEKNHSYKNGNSYFKHHYEVKKIRRQLIAKNGLICQDCLSIVPSPHLLHIHHRDENKNNHAIENIQLLCVKCHGKKRNGRHQDRLNNISLWAKLFGISYRKLYDYLNKKSAQANISRMMVLGWIIMEMNNQEEINKKAWPLMGLPPINGKSVD